MSKQFLLSSVMAFGLVFGGESVRVLNHHVLAVEKQPSIQDKTEGEPQTAPEKKAEAKKTETKSGKDKEAEKPKAYTADSWQGKTQAHIRILDRIENHVQDVVVPIGQATNYKTLQIEAKSCIKRPDGVFQDSAAFLSIQDIQLKTSPFNAWIFQQEPSLSVFQNAVYNVQLVGCDGQDVAPFPVVQVEQAGNTKDHQSPEKTSSAKTENPEETTHSPQPGSEASDKVSPATEPSAENPDPSAP